MQAFTLKQQVATISTDLAEMEKWMVARQEQANREGSLDIQFLSSRFEKGTKRVNEFAELNHLYIESDGLLNVQPDCLKFMATSAAALGNSTFLGSNWYKPPFHDR